MKVAGESDEIETDENFDSCDVKEEV